MCPPPLPAKKLSPVLPDLFLHETGQSTISQVMSNVIEHLNGAELETIKEADPDSLSLASDEGD
jgi:hypothetical protein